MSALIGGKTRLLQPVAFANAIVSIGDYVTFALAPDSVVVGPGCGVPGGATAGIVIGHISALSGTSTQSIVMGDGSNVNAPASLAIGPGNTVISSTDTAVVGSFNTVNTGLPLAGFISVLGGANVVTSGFSVCIGDGNNIGSTSQNTINIGQGNTLSANSPDSTAIGGGVVITGSQIVAIGTDINVDTTVSVAIGSSLSVDVSSTSGVVIGNGASLVNSSDSVTIGSGASSSGANNSVTVGVGSTAEVLNAVVIGNTAAIQTDIAGDGFAVAIGFNAIIGPGANFGSAGSIAIGSQAAVSCGQSVAIGQAATATQPDVLPADGLVVIGALATGHSALAIALGFQASVPVSCVGSQAYGAQSAASLPNEVVFGGLTVPIAEFHAVSPEAGPLDLFRFDVTGLVNDLDTDFYLLYKDNGTIKFSQVFLQVDEIDATHGHLWVPVAGLG